MSFEKKKIFFPSKMDSTESMDLVPESALNAPPTIQWVECSRCEKWRIIPPRPDGQHEEVPEVWFCEMNSDLERNFCDAPEQEYVQPVAPTVRRLPKSNDAEAVLARLKSMSTEELERAFASLDLDRVLREEFGDTLDSARSENLVVLPRAVGKVTAKIDWELYGRLVEEGRRILPKRVVDQFTHK